MRFEPPLVPGRLIRRYKRFLADVALDAGGEITAHCPNPGAMTGLDAPGLRVWLEPTPGKGRKLNHAWRLAELPGGHWAGIDASLPNKVVGEALRAGAVPGLAGYESVRAEVPYGTGSRVDFVLSGRGRAAAYVEVKNVHLRRAGDLAEFPDCVTARGAKHLRELAGVAQAGGRAVLLYFVQRSDCARLALAGDIDPGYAAAAAEARAAGVEMMAHRAVISVEGVDLGPAPSVEGPKVRSAPASGAHG